MGINVTGMRASTFRLAIERCTHGVRLVYLYCYTWKIKTRSKNAVKSLTLLKLKIWVPYWKPCPCRRKTHSFGFCGWGEGLPERRWKPQWSIPEQSTAGLGDHHSGSSCSTAHEIATGPWIPQILNHFLPLVQPFLLLSNGSSNPASSTTPLLTEAVATPFELSINTEFPWSS